jgi:hypothetical protein
VDLPKYLLCEPKGEDDSMKSRFKRSIALILLAVMLLSNINIVPLLVP